MAREIERLRLENDLKLIMGAVAVLEGVASWTGTHLSCLNRLRDESIEGQQCRARAPKKTRANFVQPRASASIPEPTTKPGIHF
jgi:hypothetical protein